MMAADQFALVPVGASLPLRVAEGAATLPTLYSADAVAGGGLSKISVAVGTGDGVPDDAVGVFLLHPTLASFVRGAATVSTVVCDRWSGNEVLVAFVGGFTATVSRAQFIHLRATVPANAETDMESELLSATLLLERVGIHSMGDIASVVVDRRHASVTTRLAPVGDERAVLHISIVASNAESPNVRVDFHGSQEIAVVAIPDRDSGSAPAAAYRVTHSGQQVLPTTYSDPVRSSLIELHRLVERGAVGADIDRLGRSIVETQRLLTAAI